MQLVRQRRCCSIISAESCLQVRRNEVIPGGTSAAISAIRSSLITPGPLGMCDTRPSADAPHSMAIAASSMLAMQQTFTRGLRAGFILHRIRETPGAFHHLLARMTSSEAYRL